MPSAASSTPFSVIRIEAKAPRRSTGRAENLSGEFGLNPLGLRSAWRDTAAAEQLPRPPRIEGDGLRRIVAETEEILCR
jgi:hypothetical protein